MKPEVDNSNKRFSRYYTYIPPLLKTPIAKAYASYTLTFITMAIFIFFAIKPTVETILVLEKKLQDSKEVLAKITQKSENLSLGRKNYQALDESVKQKINTAIPTTVNLKTLISSLETAANSNQASISAIQIQPVTIANTDPKVAMTLDHILFTFNLEGPYSTLVKVLQQIQSSPRIITIDNLIFNKSTETKTLIMSITGKAYYLK